METEQERISEVIAHFCKSKAEFARRMDVRPQVVSNWVARGAGKQVLSKILTKFPEVNANWLLTGEGKMLNRTDEDALSRIGANRDKGDKENFVSEVTEQSSKEFRIVEFVDLHASAGPLGMNNIDILPDTNRRLIPREYESGNLLVVRVDGDSMNDGTPRSLYDGDEVLIVERTYNHWYDLPIRKNLFVICSRGGNVLKQISEINRIKGYIVCHSFNPLHADYRIAFEDIYQVFVVLHVVYRKISVD
jgi:hypothetical protein